MEIRSIGLLFGNGPARVAVGSTQCCHTRPCQQCSDPYCMADWGILGWNRNQIGHGICGLARFSIRSLTAVLSFMTVGVAAAVTVSSIPFLRQELRTTGVPESSGAIRIAVTALTLGLALVSKPTKEVYGAIASGSLGALGLAVSGMVNTSKVIGFLDVSRLWNGGNYDPTLITVMGAGMVVSTLSYQMLDQSNPPLCAPKWSIPAKRTIDNRLVGGAALFGIGWGLTGICPGPALWQLGSGSIPMATLYFPAFLAGTYIGEVV
jgi:uncharacterized protein